MVSPRPAGPICVRLWPRLSVLKLQLHGFAGNTVAQRASFEVARISFLVSQIQRVRVSAIWANDMRAEFGGEGQDGKGVKSQLCKAPKGPFRQLTLDPFTNPRPRSPCPLTH